MLDQSLLAKLTDVERRYEELGGKLSDPEVLAKPGMMQKLAKEHADLRELVETLRVYQDVTRRAEEARELERDPEMRDMAREEHRSLIDHQGRLEEQLKQLLLPKDPNDDKSILLEIRAGTGGEEAALFARDLFEMYRRYAEVRRWNFIVSDFSPSDRGGYKEVIVNVKASGAFRRLRFEGGGHRVQRVPETEAQGRIHTSAATVAVLPELPDVKIEINTKDVEEFGCRGGGPGGQNVNKVETGWFIRHKPSGLQFKMTEHKSQTQNKERAWALLRATLHEAEQAKQHANLTSARKAMMGSGDRSQRIRTYNFPQNRCTDHRLGGEGGGEKNFNLDQIMQGQMDPLIDALLELDKQQRLEEL
jgi:peptide chain release factor 1